MGWLIGWGRGGAATPNHPPRIAWNTRPTREWEQRWRLGLSGEGNASAGETCDLRSSSTPAPSRPEVPDLLQWAALIPCVASQGPSGRITDHETGFREVSMEHPAYTPVVERPASPIGRDPVATRLDVPLLAIMFNLLGGRDRWRRLPILRSLTRQSPRGV